LFEREPMNHAATPAQERIRVVRIAARLNVGGVARHVAWLTASLPGAGYPTLLVTGTVPPGEDDMSYFATEQGVEPLVLSEMSRAISVRDVVAIWKLFRLFVRLRPEIVHTHTAKAGLVGRVAGFCYRWLTPAILLGRPRPLRCVHTYHGHVFHSYFSPLKTRVFVAIERLLARAATDRIVVLSPQQYREIHETFGVGRADQFAIVPLGLDLSAFANASRRRQLVRSEVGADEETILVGIVGRLTEIKNHHLFLRAAADYKQKHATGGRRVCFVVLGDGHLRQRLEEEAQALGLGTDVHFLGNRRDPENFYPALDVVALTSLNEGTPLTLIEAMGNARPVIATAVGGVVDLLGDPLQAGEQDASCVVCERGVRVQPKDAAAFARGLARLVGDEALRRGLGERGRHFVERHHAKDRLVADVKSLYDQLLRPQSGENRYSNRRPSSYFMQEHMGTLDGCSGSDDNQSTTPIYSPGK